MDIFLKTTGLIDAPFAPLFVDGSLNSVMLPNFVGIKFTKEDFMDYRTCLNFENGRDSILWGRDECMLAALALGAKGLVGSTYNYGQHRRSIKRCKCEPFTRISILCCYPAYSKLVSDCH